MRGRSPWAIRRYRDFARTTRGHSSAALAADRYRARSRLARPAQETAAGGSLPAVLQPAAATFQFSGFEIRGVAARLHLLDLSPRADGAGRSGPHQAERCHFVRRLERADLGPAVCARRLGAAQARPLAPQLHQAILWRLSADS